MDSAVKKVVIPVAGLGTRGLPFTKEVPKEMLPIIDTPTIHYIVEEVLHAGIEQVIFVTSKGKSMLEDYFAPSPGLVAWLRKKGKEALADKVEKLGELCEVISVRQKEPLGLGHAVWCARHAVGDHNFAVCLGDEIFPSWTSKKEGSEAGRGLKALVDASVQLKSSVIGVMEVAPHQTTSYGIIDVAGQPVSKATPAKVLRTVEKPQPDVAPSLFAIIGRYVFQPVLFDYLSEVKAGVGGEIQLTDGMDRLAKTGKLYALQMQGNRYDIGNHLYYVRAQVDAALHRPELAAPLKEYLKTL